MPSSRGRFAEVQDLCFQTAKRSDMGCAELKSLLADCQEWCIQSAKSSDLRSANLQEG